MEKTYEEKFKERKDIQKKVIARGINAQKPFMEDDDIEAFEREMLELGKRKGHIDVLEWGSGYSTKYFPDLLVKNKIKFTWDSIEYDVRWMEALDKLTFPKSVKLYLFDEEILRIDDRRALRGYPMDDYVNFPATLGKKYDLIFVDGTKRVRCMKKALNLLEPDGIVILHDAHRVAYIEGMNLYNGKRLTHMLWLGKLKQL